MSKICDYSIFYFQKSVISEIFFQLVEQYKSSQYLASVRGSASGCQSKYINLGWSSTPRARRLVRIAHASFFAFYAWTDGYLK